MYFLRRHNPAAGAVDSQYDRFNGGVVGKTLQLADCGLRIQNDAFDTNQSNSVLHRNVEIGEEQVYQKEQAQPDAECPEHSAQYPSLGRSFCCFVAHGCARSQRRGTNEPPAYTEARCIGPTYHPRRGLASGSASPHDPSFGPTILAWHDIHRPFGDRNPFDDRAG